jgi:hypothetical protein
VRTRNERPVRLLLVSTLVLQACGKPPSLPDRAAAMRCEERHELGVLVFGEFAHPGRLPATMDLTVDRAVALAGGRPPVEFALMRCGRTFHLSHAPWAEVQGIPLRAGDRLIAPDPDSVY